MKVEPNHWISAFIIRDMKEPAYYLSLSLSLSLSLPPTWQEKMSIENHRKRPSLQCQVTERDLKKENFILVHCFRGFSPWSSCSLFSRS
jgi:hypothetical protein